MPAHIENYEHEIKQLPFRFPASRFSSTPQPWGATACTAGDFVEQMNNCGLIYLAGGGGESPGAIDKQEAEISEKEE